MKRAHICAMRTLKFLSLTSSLLMRAFCRNGVSPKLLPSPLLCSVLEDGEKDMIGVLGFHGHYFSSAVETSLEFEKDQHHDDGKTMEKAAALQLAISRLAGDFDKESMLSLRRFFGSRYAPVISTGSLKLDLALGIGGLPKGRIVEIFGKEASGKTTLALHIIKEAQKLGGYCAYLDIENAMDPSLAEAMGVDTENLLIARPNSAENSLSIVDTLINSGSVDVVVVDSVAALVPEHEIAGVIDITSQDIQSRLMNRALRKIHMSLCRSQTLLILVNQVRSNLRSIQDFGHINEVTCGGNAIKFYSAIRLRITRDGLLQTGNEITGIGVSVQVVKNKFAPAMKKAGLNIRFGRGFFREAEVLDMASELSIVSREGEGYWIEGEFCKDKPAAEQYLVENKGVTDELVRILRSQLTERR